MTLVWPLPTVLKQFHIHHALAADVSVTADTLKTRPQTTCVLQVSTHAP